MLEMFRSRGAWDEHMRQPYNTEGNKILEDLLREPSDLRLMDEKWVPVNRRSGLPGAHRPPPGTRETSDVRYVSVTVLQSDLSSPQEGELP